MNSAGKDPDRPAPDGWAAALSLRNLRAGSGLVMFTFVAMHLINHALLLISLPQAELARAWLAAPWRTYPGTVLLYGAAAVHLALTLLTLYRRQTLMMPPTEFLRLVLGLMIPYFVAEHAVAARMSLALYGDVPGYTQVVRSLWITSPTMGVQQTIALLVVWTHGCIGISFLLRHRAGLRPYLPLLTGAAVLLPTLALTGFAMTGRWLELQDAYPGVGAGIYTPGMRRVVSASLPAPAVRAAELAAISVSVKTGYICLVALIMVAREFRLFRARVRSISIAYSTGERVQVQPGTSVLEASRANGIPHYGICGGNARCSTCRVRVTASAGLLPPPSPAETATLTRIRAERNIRLACQLRPAANITVELQMQPDTRASDNLRAAAQSPREREIAVLFCDLRGFTKFSEKRLPYDVVFMLNRYFVIVGEAVAGAGGRLDKFIGDGAMALFGFDSGPEEASLGALRAAEAILSGTRELNETLRRDSGKGFDIAIGLHFGPAVVGVMGYGAAQTETAIGDTVNVASRLEAVAKEADCQLAVSARLLAHAGIQLPDDQLRPVSIRGRRETIDVGLFSAEALSRMLAEKSAL